MSYQIETIYLMYIYSKPEKADVSAKEIEALLVELDEYLFGRGESEETRRELGEAEGYRSLGAGEQRSGGAEEVD